MIWTESQVEALVRDIVRAAGEAAGAAARLALSEILRLQDRVGWLEAETDRLRTLLEAADDRADALLTAENKRLRAALKRTTTINPPPLRWR